MRRRTIGIASFVALGAVAIVACSTQKKATKDQPLLPAIDGLQSVKDFEEVSDDQQRSVAIYAEMSKVLTHPRCTNCHPVGESPLQGDESLPHQPLVVRGEDGHGAPGMKCQTCHGPENFQNMPGDPHWHLAPVEMAWVGKTPGEICEQIKDPERNGGKSMAEIVDHMKNDSLVAWGWNPPKQLEPVPGSQALFGQLTEAWVDAGAHCPEP